TTNHQTEALYRTRTVPVTSNVQKKFCAKGSQPLPRIRSIADRHTKFVPSQFARFDCTRPMNQQTNRTAEAGMPRSPHGYVDVAPLRSGGGGGQGRPSERLAGSWLDDREALQHATGLRKR